MARKSKSPDGIGHSPQRRSIEIGMPSRGNFAGTTLGPAAFASKQDVTVLADEVSGQNGQGGSGH